MYLNLNRHTDTGELINKMVNNEEEIKENVLLLAIFRVV